MTIDAKRKPELMAPAGDWDMLSATANAGADAVYFGVEQLNMRAKAKNFHLTDLRRIVDFCRERQVATRLTLNTIVFEHEMDQVRRIVEAARKAGVDMIICWDGAVMDACRAVAMPFCVSTQASVSNSAAAEWYRRQGAARVVLARECDLGQIKKIRATTDMEIEVFVHGALCVAVSGRCFLSHHLFGRSANRGACAQPCRREYEITDTQDGEHTLTLGSDYVMSPKDLCSIGFIDRLIDAGVDAFKIEGRKRSAEYAAISTKVYREAIDAHLRGVLTDDMKKEMAADLARVFNRGFSSGFLLGPPRTSDMSDRYGSHATTRKVFLGHVLNYYGKSGIAHGQIDAGPLNVGDEVCVIGKTTGVAHGVVTSLMLDGIDLARAEKGDQVTFPFATRVRKNDQMYKIVATDDPANPRNRKEQL